MLALAALQDCACRRDRARRDPVDPTRSDRRGHGDRPHFRGQLRYVILPQAVRRFLPPWINSVTDAVKGSSLVSLVGIVDLMLASQQVIGRTYEPMPLYLLGAVMYFAINYSLSVASRRLEARYAYIRE